MCNLSLCPFNGCHCCFPLDYIYRLTGLESILVVIEHKKVSVNDNSISGLPFLDDKFQCFCLYTTRYACSCEDLRFSDTLHRLFSRTSGAFWKLFELFEIGRPFHCFVKFKSRTTSSHPLKHFFFGLIMKENLSRQQRLKKKKKTSCAWASCALQSVHSKSHPPNWIADRELSEKEGVIRILALTNLGIFSLDTRKTTAEKVFYLSPNSKQSSRRSLVNRQKKGEMAPRKARFKKK